MQRRRKRKTPHSLSELTGTRASRRKVNRDMTPTLALVPDDRDLDDDTHDRLDMMVVSSQRLKAFEPSHLFAIAGLLATIVQCSETTLSPRYENLDNAVDLLEHNPELMEMLKVAWAKKSFKDIRRLGSYSSIGLPRMMNNDPAQKFSVPKGINSYTCSQDQPNRLETKKMVRESII